MLWDQLGWGLLEQPATCWTIFKLRSLARAARVEGCGSSDGCCRSSSSQVLPEQSEIEVARAARA